MGGFDTALAFGASVRRRESAAVYSTTEDYYKKPVFTPLAENGLENYSIFLIR